jgi:hypothetical protein
MPTIKDISGPYRFFFYSLDCREPPHVHARREGAECKYWLRPIRLAHSYLFTSRDLAAIKRIIFENRIRMLEVWREHCSPSD